MSNKASQYAGLGSVTKLLTNFHECHKPDDEEDESQQQLECQREKHKDTKADHDVVSCVTESCQLVTVDQTQGQDEGVILVDDIQDLCRDGSLS